MLIVAGLVLALAGLAALIGPAVWREVQWRETRREAARRPDERWRERA